MNCPNCNTQMNHVGFSGKKDKLYHCDHCGTLESFWATTTPKLLKAYDISLKALKGWQDWWTKRGYPCYDSLCKESRRLGVDQKVLYNFKPPVCKANNDLYGIWVSDENVLKTKEENERIHRTTKRVCESCQSN